MYKYLLFFSLFQRSLFGVSIVYNFRIAQITKEPIVEQSDRQRHHRVIFLSFDQYYKKYSGIRQNYVGSLAAYTFDFSQWFFRTDAAFSYFTEKDCTTKYSDVATDDILFTLGRNVIINDRTTITASGLFGIPTHKINQLQHADFGYGQVGTGLQLDGVYNVNHHNGFVWGTRYLYFIPRSAYDSACEKHTFTIGNVADILVASKNNWDRQGLELGYTARFNFGAHACPDFDDISRRTNYIRSSFYAVYQYRFMIKEIPNNFLFNIGYGFDHTPKKYGNKYIITLWASWSVNF